MSGLELSIFVCLVAGLATLYASVGHGGASGYLAAMALLGTAPEAMKPTALTLNILVAGMGTIQFARAGHFVGSRFFPFAALSMPCAFLGGLLTLPTWLYQPLVAVALGWAAWRLARRPASSGLPETDAAPPRRLPLPTALAAGAGIGLVAGLTGVGGGIYLSPLLLLAGWASPRQTAAVSAAFVLANSVTGLGGHLAAGAEMPWTLIAAGAPAAFAGGLFGTVLGSRRLPDPAIRRLLAAVLFLAALKLLFTTASWSS